MIIAPAASTIPSPLIRNIGFFTPFAPLEVPRHLIAQGGVNRGSVQLSSHTPPKGGSSSSKGAGGVSGTPPANGSGGAGDRHTLTNGRITIDVKNVGAELTSLRSEKTGLEYMWEGDPKHWGKHAPVLFPIVGRLKDDQYKYKGKTYHMNQHGLARTMPFEVAVKTPEGIMFRLRYDEKTLEQYPFKFELLIGYTLDYDELRVSYQVKNLGNEPMYFSIGAHPGFRCPLLPTEEYGDYRLMWDEGVRLKRYFLEDGLVASHTEPLMLGENELRLTRDMFDRDAIVLKDVKFESVKLLNPDTGHGVTMSMTGFPYFGIWAKPKADFVCLEPWCGVGDGVNASGFLEHKEGIIKLDGNGAFRASYTIKPS